MNHCKIKNNGKYKRRKITLQINILYNIYIYNIYIYFLKYFIFFVIQTDKINIYCSFSV